MKAAFIELMTKNCESFAHHTPLGIEFWLARDIQVLLGYDQWKNFLSVLSRAQTVCRLSNHYVSDHFADVCKTIKMPKGAEKQVDDFLLTCLYAI